VSWRALGCAVILAGLGGGWRLAEVLWAQAPGSSDPVERLRIVLRETDQAASVRDQRVKECLRGLRSPSELHRALVLQEWRDRMPDSPLASIDQVNRTAIFTAFANLVRESLQRGEPEAQMATLEMLAEMASSARINSEPPSVARRFAPEVANLVVHGSPRVAEPAARSLGRMEPEVSVAVPALTYLLQATNQTLRLAAADGLGGLLVGVQESAMQGGVNASLRASRRDVILVAVSVAPAVHPGLTDAVPAVRRSCLDTVRAAAATLARLAGDRLTPDGSEMPEGPSGRSSALERAELLPLVQALRDQGLVLARCLHDRDAQARLLAAKTLEEMAQARWRMAGATTAPPANGAVMPGGPEDMLLECILECLPGLADAVADPEVRVRRAALDVLELLGPEAAPAINALVRALTDRDRFVRWSAARALGRIGPRAAQVALPSLARLLGDADLDLGLAAAAALEKMMPALPNSTDQVIAASNPRQPSVLGQTTVPALVASLQASDARMRLAAIHALRTLAGEAVPPIPALVMTLDDSDARVRQAAAELLGILGPRARPAIPHLRKKLNDPTVEVRRAASDALIGIARPQ
jgi:HEAT repeat protein